MSKVRINSENMVKSVNNNMSNTTAKRPVKDLKTVIRNSFNSEFKAYGVSVPENTKNALADIAYKLLLSQTKKV